MTDGPTARTPRWWDSGERSIEAEERWFEEAGLDFRLDRDLLEQHEVVVFRGELRLGKRTTAASVHYPPAYDVDGLPVVVAPDLQLGRHQDPNGQFCLDHPVFGESLPMYGAEAVARAERLWDLWENDRNQLAHEEADAPDPRANYYLYEHDSAVVLIDVDVAGFHAGYARLNLLEFRPFRGGVTQIKTTEPTATEVDAPPGIASFAGPREAHGPWIRLDESPPVREPEFTAWIKEHCGEWIGGHLSAAPAVHRGCAPRRASRSALHRVPWRRRGRPDSECSAACRAATSTRNVPSRFPGVDRDNRDQSQSHREGDCAEVARHRVFPAESEFIRDGRTQSVCPHLACWP
jgi:hypothetical protein